MAPTCGRGTVAADRGLAYATRMSFRLTLAGFALCALGAVTGCGSVKQQQPPRIPDEDPGMADDAMDGGSDMAAPEKDTMEVAEGNTEMSAEEKKAMCCQQCVDGMSKDESGDPPGALNCAKLVEPACVLYFDKNPMTAGEAQKCVETDAEGGAEDAPEPDAEG